MTILHMAFKLIFAGADEKEDYHRLRRRFLKDKEGIRNIFMKRQMRLKKTREVL